MKDLSSFIFHLSFFSYHRGVSDRVVVMTEDVVGARMAGPGIRAFHFAAELSTRFDTTLVARLEGATGSEEPFRMMDWDSGEALEAIEQAAVVIGQPGRRILRARRGKHTIYDLFDPVVLELEEMRGSEGWRGRIHRAMESRRLIQALERGERLIAATDQQRDLYSGIAFSAGLPPVEERWLTVPFGVPEDDPPVVERASPPVVIWNGGVWPWLDPETAVEAIEEVNRRGTQARLLFMGTGRPNARVTDSLPRIAVPGASAYVEWNDDWVPYRERAAVIGRASVSLMLHRRSSEARYSIRTRLFDAIWCGVPVVATEGGFAADLVDKEELGIVVPPEDSARVADAIEKILQDDDFRMRSVTRLREQRDRYRWSDVCSPLVEAIGELLANR
jgi:glycosyltransferase involved in cell wall biosynthesis